MRISILLSALFLLGCATSRPDRDATGLIPLEYSGGFIFHVRPGQHPGHPAGDYVMLDDWGYDAYRHSAAYDPQWDILYQSPDEGNYLHMIGEPSLKIWNPGAPK